MIAPEDGDGTLLYGNGSSSPVPPSASSGPPPDPLRWVPYSGGTAREGHSHSRSWHGRHWVRSGSSKRPAHVRHRPASSGLHRRSASGECSGTRPHWWHGTSKNPHAAGHGPVSHNSRSFPRGTGPVARSARSLPPRERGIPFPPLGSGGELAPTKGAD